MPEEKMWIGVDPKSKDDLHVLLDAEGLHDRWIGYHQPKGTYIVAVDFGDEAAAENDAIRAAVMSAVVRFQAKYGFDAIAIAESSDALLSGMD